MLLLSSSDTFVLKKNFFKTFFQEHNELRNVSNFTDIYTNNKHKDKQIEIYPTNRLNNNDYIIIRTCNLFQVTTQSSVYCLNIHSHPLNENQ